jgi:hypothetical protein
MTEKPSYCGRSEVDRFGRGRFIPEGSADDDEHAADAHLQTPESTRVRRSMGGSIGRRFGSKLDRAPVDDEQTPFWIVRPHGPYLRC